MTIEVKQLVIKSTVADSDAPSAKNAGTELDMESFKKELLAECRQIVSESMSNRRER